LGRHLDCLQKAAEELSDLRLIIIDPLLAYMRHVNTYKDTDVRSVLTPLAKFAATNKIAVVGIVHLNKAVERTALHRVSGSGALTAVPRLVWGFGQPNSGEERYVMALIKANTRASENIAYRIEDVHHADLNCSQPKIVCQPGSPPETKDEVFADWNGKAKPFSAKSPLETARELIHDILADGPRLTEDVESEAQERGISPRTLDRARKELAIIAFKRDSKWWMRLPTDLTSSYGGLGGLDEKSTENKELLKNASLSLRCATGVLDEASIGPQHNNNHQQQSAEGCKPVISTHDGGLEERNKSHDYSERTPSPPRMTRSERLRPIVRATQHVSCRRRVSK
jgi:hypothetical protein